MRCENFPGSSAMALSPSLATGKAGTARQIQADFFVATEGDDHWSGTLPEPNREGTDGPFATLPGAREAIRQLKMQGEFERPVTVMVRNGTYALSGPFVLRPEDSGTEACPITYASYPGEKPILSGGKRIAGWQSSKGPLWTAEVPEVRAGQWSFRQLFVNGQRCARARLPREGYYAVADAVVPEPRDDPKNKQGFRYQPGDLQKDWTHLQEVEIVVLQHWMAARLPIADIDEETHTVRCAGPSWRPLTWSKGYYVENVYEGLTGPGDWYLNRHTGVLSYWPRPGEDMTRAEVIAPVTEQLLRLEGDVEAEAWVQHLVLRDLAFHHNSWTLPAEGYAHPQGELPIPAAIYAEGARHCRLEGCEIAHLETWGMELGRGCWDNYIGANQFFDLGAGGIKIGEPVTRENDAEEAGHTIVADNTFAEGALVYLGSPAIWIGQSSGNTVCHNEVHGPWQWAVSVGWNWSYMPPNRTRDNTIEYNHLHHVGTGVLGAHSVIYTLGVSPGTVIRHNLIHHSGGYGIALDASCSGILVENNVIYHQGQGGLHFNWYCLGNIVQNNIFAFGRQGQMTRYGDPPPGDDTNCNILQRNVFYWQEGSLYNETEWPNYRMVQDYNLYWHVRGGPFPFLTFGFDEWQRKGLDQHSLVADPLFVDPAREDFSLRPESPAFRLGFRPIDLTAVGPRC